MAEESATSNDKDGAQTMCHVYSLYHGHNLVTVIMMGEKSMSHEVPEREAGATSRTVICDWLALAQSVFTHHLNKNGPHLKLLSDGALSYFQPELIQHY